MKDAIFNSLEEGNCISYNDDEGKLRFGRVLSKNTGTAVVTVTPLEIDGNSEPLSNLSTSHLYEVLNLIWMPDKKTQTNKDRIDKMISVINFSDFKKLQPRAVGNSFQFTSNRMLLKSGRCTPSTQFTESCKGQIAIMEKLVNRLYSTIMSVSDGLKNRASFVISCSIEDYYIFVSFVNGILFF